MSTLRGSSCPSSGDNDAFRNAETFVQRAELGYAVTPRTANLRAYGIHAGQVPPFARCLERVRTLDGTSEIASGLGSR